MIPWLSTNSFKNFFNFSKLGEQRMNLWISKSPYKNTFTSTHKTSLVLRNIPSRTFYPGILHWCTRLYFPSFSVIYYFPRLSVLLRSEFHVFHYKFIFPCTRPFQFSPFCFLCFPSVCSRLFMLSLSPCSRLFRFSLPFHFRFHSSSSNIYSFSPLSVLISLCPSFLSAVVSLLFRSSSP